MEENTEGINPEYLKGFNEGYLLQKYQPDIANSITLALGDSPHSVGIKDGGKEFLSEKLRNYNPAWLQKDRFTNPEINSGVEKSQEDRDRV